MMDFPSNPTDGQASNGYTWNAAKGAWVGGPGTRYTQAEADAKFVDVTGDTMTGHLFLPTGPAAANAIRKDYVDPQIALKADKTYVDSQDATKANASALASYMPVAGGTFTGAIAVPAMTISSAANYLTFYDTDWGNRYIHCNGGAIGFLSAAGGWTHQFYNDGSMTINSNLNVGAGGILGVDGNLYMSWAGDWLSNVLGGKAPYGGVNGQWTVSAAGYLVTTLGGSDVQSAAATGHLNSFGTVRRCTSSQDYKTQIEDIEPEYADKVLSLRTVFYRPVTSEPEDWSRFGFIAEDAYAVDFRFANCEPEAPTTPVIHDINGIVSALLDVVRRQGERIAALEAGP